MGGGAPSIPQINLTQSLGQIFGAFRKQEMPLFQQYFNKQPLLAGSRAMALGMQQQVPQLTSPLLGAASQWVNPVLASGGAATPEQEQATRQLTYNAFSQLGNLRGNQAIGTLALNEDAARRQRFNEALQQSLGISQGVQGLETGAITPALQTQQAATGTFMNLLDPLMQYGGQLQARNQQAAAEQSIAGANKGSSALGAGVSLIGAAATAY